MLGEKSSIQSLQVKALAARQDGDGDFADFRCGENEFDVGWRFLKGFQQGIEGALRQHVHFIDDVNLHPRLHRGITHRVDDLAHVVNAGVGGGVHFDHIHVARFQDGFALGGDVRHVDGGTCGVVQGPCNQPRRGGFAHTAHPRQHIGLRHPARGKGVRQGAHQRLLADQVGKGLGTVFACENAIGGIGL